MSRTLIRNKPSYALQFNGTNQKLSFGNILTTKTIVTASIALNTTTLPSTNYEIPFGYGNTRWFFIYNNNTTKLQFNIKSSGVEKSSGSTAKSMVLGSSYTCIGRYDPNAGANNISLRIYDIYGNLYDSAVATITGAMDTTAQPLEIAHDPNRNFYVDCIADDPRVYSRILTDRECDGLARFIEPDPTNLELHATFNVQNESQVLCKVGDRAGYVGALTNSPTYVAGIVPVHRRPATYIP